MKKIMTLLMLVAFALSGAIAAQAGDQDVLKQKGLLGYLLQYTPSNHDDRCLIHLNYELDVSKAKVMKAFAALPADCHAACPFREIPEKFFYSHLDHALKNACRLHLEPTYSLSPNGGSASVVQLDLGNRIQVLQLGTFNVVASYQNGNGQELYVVQFGDGNWASVTQQGINNLAQIVQLGANNGMNLTQQGNNNTYKALQTGNDNRDVTQTGGENHSDF